MGTLLADVRRALRVRHCAARTEGVYVGWVGRLVRFHGMRHPRDLGPEELARFLSDLAVRGGVSASTQNQARSAIVFLYHEVLGQPLAPLDGLVRARRPPRLPVVLTRAEVQGVLGHLDGTPRLVAGMLYGDGLRLEALRLRVKDLEVSYGPLVVRGGMCRSRRHCTGSTRGRGGNGCGSGCSPPPEPTATGSRTRGTAITSIPPSFSGRFARRCERPGWRSRRRATVCVTRSPRTSSTRATTFGPCGSCSATATCGPP